MFQKFDKNKNKSLSEHELRNLLKDMGVIYKKKDLQNMIACADKNSNGEIEFREFVFILEKYVLPQTERYKAAFREFDTDNSGTIDFDELLKAL